MPVKLTSLTTFPAGRILKLPSDGVLTEVTKREILNYCDDKTEHSTYLITYSDLLIYVWLFKVKTLNKPRFLVTLRIFGRVSVKMKIKMKS
jgi:hypothetical protein